MSVFAEDQNFFTPLNSLAGMVVTFLMGLGGAYTLFKKVQSKSRSDDAKTRTIEVENESRQVKDSIDGWKNLVAAHEEQAARMRHDLQISQTLSELQQRQHMRFQRRYAEMKNTLFFVMDAYNRHHVAIKNLGGDPGEPLQIPVTEDESTLAAEDPAEFLVRQLQQRANVVKEVDKQIARQKADLETSDARPPGGK